MGFKSWHTPFWLEGFLLNEQTWLQHLKEKRLAYGLSQNRLAVATGITRQYLSDIETGKVKPSEDLQQSLWEALERFNPDAPLEMLFDYVRIRFPTTDVQQVVENILQLKLSYFRLWRNCERKLNTSLMMVSLAFIRLLLKRY